jgi:phosphoglycolate phosphatase
MYTMNLAATQALIFDLDGTLIDSERDLVQATNETLRHFGRQTLPEPQISSFIGHGAAKLVASALGPDAGPDLQSGALQYFLAYYERHSVTHTHPYPGVREALTAFSATPMAVLTNKPQRLSCLILEALDLARYFAVIVGGDSLPSRKPDPAGVWKILEQFGVAARNALMIGDSEVDVQTARNAGLPCAIVNYGFGTNNRAAFPADLYIDSLTDLVPLLRKAAP